MGGFKRRLKESLQFRLSFSIGVVIIFVAIAAGAFSFLSAMDEAHELQDGTLRQIAALALQNPSATHLLQRTPPPGAASATDNEEDANVTIQYLNRRNANGMGSPILFPPDLSDGFHTITVNDESFRVLVTTTNPDERMIVAQETAIRNEIARDSALRTLMPLVILFPVLLLIIADLIRRMFRPIEQLSDEIDSRPAHALHPVEENNIPAEILPFISAINRLLGRVVQTLQSQRRFIADAAHELRSPLTALSLQTEMLADSDMSEPARQQLKTLQLGIGRSRNLLEQLLTLAKIQSGTDVTVSKVSVRDTFRTVLEDLMPLAHARHIDIGLADSQDAQINASELDLKILIKNLVDNAIRYSPEGGRVDFSVRHTPHHVVMKIADAGPGIAPDDRNRVFDPFYRSLGTEQTGSGLGLSIVKAIADKIGATIQLEYTQAESQSGLTVTVKFPTSYSSSDPAVA